ncbi:MAG: peptide ABC transporter substrate-binding protein [Oscillospiraceae bacterium]|nr:peptide ABC transporter substrate-binding protein [Oscillospiraceae bacterium]
MKKILTILFAVSLAFGISGCDAVDRIKDSLAIGQESGGEVETVIHEEEISNSISLGVLDYDTFNPLTTESETVREAMQLVYEPLFELDGEMRIIPVLAESYSVSADGRTVTVNLKSGIKWHDGSDFNAYDVAYTIKSIRNGSTTYTDALSDVVDHRITGDYSIEITLRNPVPNFAALLTFPIVQYQTPLTVSSKYTPVGTGPFKFDGKLGTDKMQFSANDEYREGRPAADNAYIVFIPDLDKYHSMFEASEIDVMTSNMVDLTQYMPKGGVSVSKFVTNKLTFLGYNFQNDIFAGSATRIGLSQFIDKDDIISSVLYSHASPVDIPINPSSYLYSYDKTVFNSDEISAMEYLEKDGWSINNSGIYTRNRNNQKQTFDVKLLTNGESVEKVGVANKVAEYFTKFGVEVTVEAVDYDEYLKRIEAKDFDMFIGEIELGSNLDLSPLIKSSWNYFTYQNTDVDTLITQLGMTVDEEEQKLLFDQLADTLMNNMPFVPLYYREGCVLAGSKIKTGIDPSVSSFYRGCEQWSTR